MKTMNLKKHVAIILAILSTVFFMASCGSSEPAEKVYLEDSEIDAALSDGNAYKGTLPARYLMSIRTATI